MIGSTALRGTGRLLLSKRIQASGGTRPGIKRSIEWNLASTHLAGQEGVVRLGLALTSTAVGISCVSDLSDFSQSLTGQLTKFENHVVIGVESIQTTHELHGLCESCSSRKYPSGGIGFTIMCLVL
jgi:hypothetical protein